MKAATARGKDRFKAGLTLAVGLAVLSAFMVVLGGHWFWEDLSPYSIRFKTVKDLTTGRPVKYGGLNIGRIQKIELDVEDPRFIKVVVGVDATFPLYQGVKARIAQKGLVGDFYVFLELSGEPGPRLVPGAVIPAEETVDFQELAKTAGELLTQIKPQVDAIVVNLNRLLSEENAKALSRILARGPEFIETAEQTLGDFKKNWAALSGSGVKVGETLNKSLDRLDKSVALAEGELRKTLSDFRNQAGKAGALAESVKVGFDYDQEQIEEILANVKSTSRELKLLISRLKERPWEIVRPPAEEAK